VRIGYTVSESKAALVALRTKCVTGLTAQPTRQSSSVNWLLK